MQTNRLVLAIGPGVLLVLQACIHDGGCVRAAEVVPVAPDPTHWQVTARKGNRAAAVAPEPPRVEPMAPMPQELLQEPIRLDCGAVIREIRDGNTINLDVLNRMCSEVTSSFEPFLEAQGIAVKMESPFSWNISFLPAGDCYRCLNDERHRFRQRVVLDHDLIGYTDIAERTIFLTSDAWDGAFRLAFVHELFHALSIHCHLLAGHPGTWQEHYAAEERLAEDFTEWLDYGR